MTTKTSPAVLADYAIARIMLDIESGTLPPASRLSDFADLHDYVDANEYMIDALEENGEDFCFADEAPEADCEDQVNRTNAAQQIVTEWLASK